MDCLAKDGWAGGAWRKDVPAGWTGRRTGLHLTWALKPWSGHGGSGLSAVAEPETACRQCARISGTGMCRIVVNP